MLAELLPEKGLPNDAIGFVPASLDEPLARRNVLESSPVVEPLGAEDMEAVAQARGHRKRLEPEQRNRVAEGKEPAGVEDGHRRPAPLQVPRESQPIEPTKVRAVGAADEMVELLGRDPAEIEGARHTSGRGPRLEHRDLVPLFEQIQGGGQAHHAGTDDDDPQEERLICFKARRLGATRLFRQVAKLI